MYDTWVARVQLSNGSWRVFGGGYKNATSAKDCVIRAYRGLNRTIRVDVVFDGTPQQRFSAVLKPTGRVSWLSGGQYSLENPMDSLVEVPPFAIPPGYVYKTKDEFVAAIKAATKDVVTSSERVPLDYQQKAPPGSGLYYTVWRIRSTDEVVALTYAKCCYVKVSSLPW